MRCALPALGLVLVLAATARAGDQPKNLREHYEDTPGQTERPGKHSTTVGRHGTTGEAGGGIDAQSGPRHDGDDPVLEQRQREENEAERRETD